MKEKLEGKSKCVAFAPTASRIIQIFSSVAKDQDPDKEKISIIETAAKLIL